MARRGAGTAATSAWRAEPYVEYCIQGPAVSGQSKNRPRLRIWKAKVAAAARAAWPDKKIPMPDSVHLDVHISEFSAFATVDRDNLSKPVLDAMQTIVYENDRQVKHWDVEWCDIEGAYVVRYMSPIVAAALSVGKEFLWVRVLPHSPRQDLVR